MSGSWNSGTNCYNMTDRQYYCGYENTECQIKYPSKHEKEQNYNCDHKPKKKCHPKDCEECDVTVDQCLYQDGIYYYQYFYIKNKYQTTCADNGKCSSLIQSVEKLPLNGTKAQYIKKFELPIATCATLDVICTSDV